MTSVCLNGESWVMDNVRYPHIQGHLPFYTREEGDGYEVMVEGRAHHLKLFFCKGV